MAISQESLESFRTATTNVDLSSLNGEYNTTRTENDGWSVFNFGASSTSGQSLVGITAELATAFGTALTEYRTPIDEALNAMVAKEATVGFKGEAVNSAIKGFVERVIEVSKEYLTALENVQKEMIAAVEKSYSTQDTSMKTSVTTDASKITENQYSTQQSQTGGES